MSEQDRPPDEGSIFRPATPPSYPGFGEPGWFGGTGGGTVGRPAPSGQGSSGPGPYSQGPYPLPAGSGRAHAGRQRTPWVAVAAVALLVGLTGGAVGAGVIVAVDDGSAAGGDGGFGPTDPIDADPPALPADNVSLTRVADTVLPSVVQVRVEAGQQGATGSGFVLDDDGRIVTNAHVVEPADDEGSISVVLPSGRERAAELIGRSRSYDLAVLQIDSDALAPARLGASGPLQVGQTVVAFGSPLGLTSTVTSGIVSALDRPVTTGAQAESSYINAIQTDAAINPGNSGGPLVDMQGRVVGVNSAIATVGSGLGGQGGNIGVGFAIPIDQVRLTADQIIETGRAVYPVIGATVDATEGQPAVVDEVNADSPAERAGLRTGDTLLAIDGEPVADGIELIVTIRSRQPGETIELTFERDGDTRTVDLVLAEAEG